MVSEENRCRISALRRSICSRRFSLMLLVRSEKKRVIAPSIVSVFTKRVSGLLRIGMGFLQMQNI